MARSYFAIRRNALLRSPYINYFGRSKPRLAADDSVILFENRRQEVSFVGTSSVASVRDQDEEDDGQAQAVTFSAVHEFPEPRPLAVLAGSLQKVYRFLWPEVHFMHVIVKLSHGDYQAITKNEIDLHRSIFRYLFTALPIELQADFVRRNITSFPLSPKGELTSYQTICPSMIAYYATHVVDSFNLINRLRSEFGSLRGINGIGRLEDLYFTDGDGENAIDFGRTAQEVSTLLERNPLFVERGRNAALLVEASKQLDFPEDASAKIRPSERKWNDPIF